MAIKSNFTNMVLVLTLTCLVCSALLGGAYALTKEPIEKADLEKTRAAISEVLPEGGTIETEAREVSVSGTPYKYYVSKDGDEVVAYAIESKTGGFGGELTVMVGIDARTGNVWNTAPLSHSETPGLGAKCDDKDSKFRTQWQNLDPSAHAFEVKKDIDAITASTITSKAYTKCVTQALEAYKVLKEGSHE